MSPLMIASTRAVARTGIAAPLSAAVVVLAAAPRLFGTGHDLDIFRCLAFLLTAALVSAVDDPAAEMLAAAPYSIARRTVARLGVATTAVAAIWLLSLVVADITTTDAPLAGISLQGMGIAVFGVTIAVGMKRYAHINEPAVLAVPVVLALLLAAELLPQGWALLGEQTWGRPWVAEQLRWGCIVAIGVGVATRALTHSPHVQCDAKHRFRDAEPCFS